MNAAARFDESASATGSSMRPRGLFDGPFRAGPAQARPARAGRVGGTTGRDSRHGPALSSGRASPALMISCWAVFWAPVFGPCSGWPSWARPIFPALVLVHHAWCCNKILVSFAFPPSQRSCAARNLCSKLFSYGLCLSNKTGALTLKF